MTDVFERICFFIVFLLRRFVKALAVLFIGGVCAGGPYHESGISGYVDSAGRAVKVSEGVLNPLFAGWASGVAEYCPAGNVSDDWDDRVKALGPATGDNFDVVSLGDLNAAEIADGNEPGFITLVFDSSISDGEGYDFAVFENGIVSDYNTGDGSAAGEMFAELGYVEVSTDGEHFVRFGGVSLTAEQPGPYGTIEITDVYNLAGKHPNTISVCTGTGFDLGELWDREEVLSGLVDPDEINYVRIVDIPGSGEFFDDAVMFTDPNSYPSYYNYSDNHAIYDAWVTHDSGGFDVDAVGVLKEQLYRGDINLDGVVDYIDFVIMGNSWGAYFGDERYLRRCDISSVLDNVVDELDLLVLGYQWLSKESWTLRQ
jgi:hypothetical protein